MVILECCNLLSWVLCYGQSVFSQICSDIFSFTVGYMKNRTLCNDAEKLLGLSKTQYKLISVWVRLEIRGEIEVNL